MNKVIDLFNTPQAELTYIDKFMMILIMMVIFIIIICLAYLIENWRKK